MSDILLDDIFYDTLSELIERWRKDGLSEEEINKNISDINRQEVIDNFSQCALNFF